MSWGAIVVGAVGLTVNYFNQKKNRETAEGMADDALALQKEQQKALEEQKKEYKSMVFKNPFSNMENVFEDITLNQQQAQFEAQQGAQQRANIMQAFRGSAGASGIAGLAQAMASQGQIQTARISASIGAQETRNQALIAKGAQAVQTAERQGAQWVQQSEMDRQATLLGMQMGEATGANLAHQQAQANQMNAIIAGQQTQSDMFSSLASAAGNIPGAQGKKVNTGDDEALVE